MTIREKIKKKAEEWLAFVQKYLKEQYDKIHSELKSCR